MTKTIKLSELKKLANIARNHLDYIEREEGNSFPKSDIETRKLALSIESSYKVEWIIDNEL